MTVFSVSLNWGLNLIAKKMSVPIIKMLSITLAMSRKNSNFNLDITERLFRCLFIGCFTAFIVIFDNVRLFLYITVLSQRPFSFG